MRRWILIGTVGAPAIAFAAHWVWLTARTPQPVQREITLMAKSFSYTPNIIQVNRGDHLTVRLVSEDVHHGFYLDGYKLQMSARPGESARLSFVADRTGRFTFRCSVTCGALHPYMVGYLKVEPNLLLVGSLWATALLLALVGGTVFLRHEATPERT